MNEEQILPWCLFRLPGDHWSSHVYLFYLLFLRSHATVAGKGVVSPEGEDPTKLVAPFASPCRVSAALPRYGL